MQILHSKLLVTNKAICQPEIWGQEASWSGLYHIHSKLLVTNKVICQPEIWGQEASPSHLYHIHSKLHFVLSVSVLFGGINAESDTDLNTVKEVRTVFSQFG